jgi:hypothetical protein
VQALFCDVQLMQNPPFYGWRNFCNNILVFSPGSAEHSETRPIQSEASGQRIPGRENAQVQILAKEDDF